jgi:hypothetical protein
MFDNFFDCGLATRPNGCTSLAFLPSYHGGVHQKSPSIGKDNHTL